MVFKWIILLMLLVTGVSVNGQTATSSEGNITLELITKGLRSPWGFAFLPSGEILITERGGKLRRVDSNGALHTVRGIPRVYVKGQGGLMDILVPRDFSKTRHIFLSLVVRQKGGAGTAIARGTLSTDGSRLTNVNVIFEMTPGSSGGRHFGSRIVEAQDGTLFVTVGERGDSYSAQDLTRHNGSIVRITKDGHVPQDNPFVGAINAQNEIWSYGHRNPQGAALDLKGRLWAVEHGAKGGDEINQIKKGANFGWPVIAYGRHYSGQKIGEGTSKPGLQQPEYYWDPSIAPSGMIVYSGGLWPKWAGNIFVGSLKFDYISRLSGSPLREDERLKSIETKRVRDIREAPDGSIWFLSEDRGALYRMTPEN